MEFPRLGVKSQLQLQGYATATTMLDLSRVCDLHYSSWQHQILNPLSGAKDQIFILMDTIQVHYLWDTTGTPSAHFLSHYYASFFFLSCCPLFSLLNYILLRIVVVLSRRAGDHLTTPPLFHQWEKWGSTLHFPAQGHTMSYRNRR